MRGKWRRHREVVITLRLGCGDNGWRCVGFSNFSAFLKIEVMGSLHVEVDEGHVLGPRTALASAR